MSKQWGHAAHITADSSNVLSNTFGGTLPSGARRVGVLVVFSDYDFLYTLTIQGTVLARNSGPDIAVADNTGSNIANSNGWKWMDVAPGDDLSIVLEANVVTAGNGMAYVVFQ